MMEQQRKPDEEYDIVQAFRVFDADNKGYIESRDLREVLRHLETSIPSEELQQLIHDTELETDRKVTFEGGTPFKLNGSKVDLSNFLIIHFRSSYSLVQ